MLFWNIGAEGHFRLYGAPIAATWVANSGARVYSAEGTPWELDWQPRAMPQWAFLPLMIVSNVEVAKEHVKTLFCGRVRGRRDMGTHFPGGWFWNRARPLCGSS